VLDGDVLDSRPWIERFSTTIPVRVRMRKAYLVVDPAVVRFATCIAVPDQALRDDIA
jgi:hypothetical protein